MSAFELVAWWWAVGSQDRCDIYRARIGPPLGPLLLIHGGYWRPEYDRGHLRPLAVYLASLDQAVAPFLGPSVTASLRRDLDPSLLDYGRNTPIFFIHGNKDIRVPVEMSRYVTAKLKNAGERIAYLEMDNVGHFELIDPSFTVVRETLSAGLQFTFP